MSHEQTSTHKIHHNSNLGEATTFPLILFFVPGHGTNTQISIFPEILEIVTPTTLQAHNVACRPHIEVRFEETL
jgi:hypothetical protein